MLFLRPIPQDGFPLAHFLSAGPPGTSGTDLLPAGNRSSLLDERMGYCLCRSNEPYAPIRQAGKRVWEWRDKIFSLMTIGSSENTHLFLFRPSRGAGT